MAYYLRSYPGTNSGDTLVEATQAFVERADISRVGYDRVDGAWAHCWIRIGGRHETTLYVDADGRIRKGALA